MHIGICGGTFDPIHYGHLLLAEQCREQLALGVVWFMPASVPPHKQALEITTAEHRVAMLQLAIAGQPQFRVSEVELNRGGTSYTVDTLATLRAAQPEDEFVLFRHGETRVYQPRR